MASSSTQPASSSSSPASRSKYDVFLSFCGKDTRNGFVSHLYAALERKGIFAFKDDEKLQRGEYFSEQLLKAIQESMSAVVVMSPNYASSKWCLIELTEIIKCQEKTGLTILPVFYHVEPHDVRNKKPTFAEPFAERERDPRIDMVIQQWEDSLKQVGYISGWHLQERDEAIVVEEITAKISSELNSRLPLVYRNLVGIDTSVEKMMNLLDMGLNDVRFIGICGMGGIGKTTLAEVIYDRISYQFEASVFISSVREKYENHGPVFLQDHLISKILLTNEIQIKDVREGIKVISNRMQRRKILIVLDDVSTDPQLEALVESHDWFGLGSRIIMTSRDRHLLKRYDVSYLYEVDVLNKDEALELFSLSAFHEAQPKENYMDLSQSFIKYAQGLPLALKVLGSSLFRSAREAWESALDQLKANPNKKILDVLEIGFDVLEVVEKQLFLDIAFFFKGEELNGVVKETLESSGYYPSFNIEVLKEKSLITVSCFGTLEMHDLLQEMGKEIVRRESPIEPGQRSRLCRHEDIFHVLKNSTGTNAVEGIVLKLPQDTKEIILSFEGFSKMKNLRILMLSSNIIPAENQWDKLCTRIGLRHPLKSIPTEELRIMKWKEYPLESLPTNFEANKLVELNFSGSQNIKELWKGRKSFGSLKRLNMTNCEKLIKTPDFTEIQNLEELYFSSCERLSHVHQSIGSLKRLEKLCLQYCRSVTNLPDMRGLESLEYLNLTECTKLVAEKLMLRGYSRIKTLEIDGTKHTANLRLHLRPCSRVKKFPDLSGSEFVSCFDARKTAITNFPSPSLFPKKWMNISVSGCRDRQAGWGEFLWFDANTFLSSELAPNPIFDRYINGSIVDGGHSCIHESNFVKGLHLKYNREYGHYMLYFGLDRGQHKEGLRFEKERNVFDFIMTGASLETNDGRCSEWFNNITTTVENLNEDVPRMNHSKLKGCSLFFVYECHGPPQDLFFYFVGPPLIPVGCIFKSAEGVSTKPLFLWAPAIVGVEPVEFWAFVPATWFQEFLGWRTCSCIEASVFPLRKFKNDSQEYYFQSKEGKSKISLEELKDPYVDVKNCKTRLVYEDDASQFYSTVAPHSLHSEYYKHPCYHSESTGSMYSDVYEKWRVDSGNKWYTDGETDSDGETDGGDFSQVVDIDGYNEWYTDGETDGGAFSQVVDIDKYKCCNKTWPPRLLLPLSKNGPLYCVQCRPMADGRGVKPGRLPPLSSVIVLFILFFIHVFSQVS